MGTLLLLLIPAVALAADPPEVKKDVPYAEHKSTVLDFYPAQGEGPRPLLVYIHGGGWTGGDKASGRSLIAKFRAQGVSCAAVNYRLTGIAPLPAPVHDAAYAIQFLRSKAKEWNIDPDRIALTGGSAGACTSMWLLLHDDLADPQAEDPIRRFSTRVSGAAVRGGQTSIDPKQVEPWVGPNILKHRMIWTAVGAKTMAEALKNYDEYKTLYTEFSPYNHVTNDDPPLLMTYNNNMTVPSLDAGHGIHHPVLGVKLKEKSDQVGHECHLVIPEVSSSKKYPGGETEFLMRILLGSKNKPAKE